MNVPLLSYTRALTYLLCAVAFTPAIVINHFLFPYIVPRTTFFRLVIEGAFVAVAMLWWHYRSSWRWRGNYVLYVFAAFIGVNIISTFFSFSPLLAWFSDYERMWGVFTLLHVFLFYLLVRAFFGGEEWRRFFNVTLAVGAFVSLYGIVQHYPQLGITVYQSGIDRIIATLGNAAYVAIYMVFLMALAVLMFFKTKEWAWRAAYAAVFALSGFAFLLAGIRGTLVGVMAGVTVAGLLYILLGSDRRLKAGVAAGIVGLASVAFFSVMNPQHRIVQGSELLARIASISPTSGTFETRLVGWNAAWQGFKERPLFGVGLENYNVIFNKYFDSDYYLIAPSEPYFDRSHNAWLDVLVLNGIVGFLVFLGFPAVAGWYLYRGWKTGRMDLAEVLVFTAVLVIYFVHLVFVFDDLTSYLYFIAVLAFLEYRVRRDTLAEWDTASAAPAGWRAWAAGGIGLIVVLAAWNLNVKVLLAGNRVIDALQARDIPTAIGYFHDALEYDVIPSRNVVLAYGNYLTERAGSFSTLLQNPATAEALREGLERARAAMAAEIAKDPSNALLYNRFAVLNTVSYLATGNPVHAEDSLAATEKSLELSPEHLRYYYTFADMYIIGGQPERAVAALQEAVRINPAYAESYYHLAKAYMDTGDLDRAYRYLELTVQKEYEASGERVFLLLADRFAAADEPERELATLQLAYEHLPRNPQVHSRLVAAYLRRDDEEQALEVLRHLAEAVPTLASDAQYLITTIEAGKAAEVLRQLTGE